MDNKYEAFKGLIKEETSLDVDNNPQHREKAEWMSEMLNYQSLYEKGQLKDSPQGRLFENNLYATPNSTPGMGAPSFPGDPGHMSGFSTQASGSGDPVPTLLPVAMQIAAQTVGFDIVPVVQANGPWGILTYLDVVYQGGRVDAAGEDTPLTFEIGVSGATDGTFTVDQVVTATNNTSPGNTADVAFLGRSRISGLFIFRVDAIADDLSLSDVLTTTGTANADIDGNQVDTTPSLVAALDNHLAGFSGSSWTDPTPKQRDTAEQEMANNMGLRVYSQSVEMESFEASVEVTRKQIQDLKHQGIDAVSKAKGGLANDLTQSANKYILDRAFKLGSTHHYDLYDIEGVNLHLNIDTSDRTLSAMGFSDSDFNGRDNTATFDTANTTVSAAESGSSSYENLHTRQRRIATRILAGKNLIAQRGRNGMATFVVTNSQIATALQDSAQFREAPMQNNIPQNNNMLHSVGSISGMQVLVDPYMGWNDTRVLVGMKGDGEGPGLVFMPYIMGESIDLIAEGTAAPKIVMESRFQVVEAGFHPETMYLTFGVDSAFGDLA